MDAATAALDRTLSRGRDGDLIRWEWFLGVREKNSDTFVFATYFALAAFSLVLSVSTQSMVVVLVEYVLWGFLAYLFIGLGTHMSQHWAMWGIGLVATIISLLSVWSVVWRLRANRTLYALVGEHLESQAVLVSQLVLFLALSAVSCYFTAMLFRFLIAAPAAVGSRAVDAPAADQQR
ncbi:hypothetical protein [Rhodococcus sp. Q]|uniref:hypothetical protein n=1 Tax=Rhodococcus sp. Q TaxID=2502252 RepID=UPI0010FA0164|nr:hypothetical protein [Rhodococcus sp. Q]